MSAISTYGLQHASRFVEALASYILVPVIWIGRKIYPLPSHAIERTHTQCTEARQPQQSVVKTRGEQPATKVGIDNPAAQAEVRQPAGHRLSRREQRRARKAALAERREAQSIAATNSTNANVRQVLHTPKDLKKKPLEMQTQKEIEQQAQAQVKELEMELEQQRLEHQKKEQEPSLAKAFVNAPGLLLPIVALLGQIQQIDDPETEIEPKAEPDFSKTKTERMAKASLTVKKRKSNIRMRKSVTARNNKQPKLKAEKSNQQDIDASNRRKEEYKEKCYELISRSVDKLISQIPEAEDYADTLKQRFCDTLISSVFGYTSEAVSAPLISAAPLPEAPPLTSPAEQVPEVPLPSPPPPPPPPPPLRTAGMTQTGGKTPSRVNSDTQSQTAGDSISATIPDSRPGITVPNETARDHHLAEIRGFNRGKLLRHTQTNVPKENETTKENDDSDKATRIKILTETVAFRRARIQDSNSESNYLANAIIDDIEYDYDDGISANDESVVAACVKDQLENASVIPLQISKATTEITKIIMSNFNSRNQALNTRQKIIDWCDDNLDFQEQE